GDDDGDGGEARVLLHPVVDLVARDARHQEVEDDDGRELVGGERGQRFRAASGGGDVVAFVAKDLLEGLADAVFIIDDQDGTCGCQALLQSSHAPYAAARS